jgi:endonuclease/exonuclease/phosphatase (EEP) superfamily protein YafD
MSPYFIFSLNRLRSYVFVLSVVNITGCASYISIPDEKNFVSNHRDSSRQIHNYTDRHKRTREKTCDVQAPSESFERLEYAALNPDGFSLLNWNVLKGSRESWASDFRRLSLESDIVVIQEAQLHEEFYAGLKYSEMQWDLTTAFHYGDNETGVLTGSNIKPGALCSFRSTEPLIRIPKTALITEYIIEGADKILIVANIHMINFSLGTNEYSEQINQLFDVLRHHDGPLIVSGDFNTWSDERMSIISSIMLELELVAVKFDDDHRLTVFGNALDHVYFRGLEAVHANTEDLESSDHNPMMITFKLAAR